jgi:3-hydroxybutyryl-CoA dehydrogenase
MDDVLSNNRRFFYYAQAMLEEHRSEGPRDEAGRAVPGSVGIAGSGNIACGLAVACAPFLAVRLHARSAAASERARRTLARMAKSTPAEVTIVPRPEDLAGCAPLVEAVAEDASIKSDVLRMLAELPGAAPLVTTTSSLPLEELARASGAPERVAAVHLFSPVYRVPLVELTFPGETSEATRAAVHTFCAVIGKTVIEVPGVPGFVVNRVVFPMLLAAVETLELTGLEPESIDTAVRLALGYPLGPLRTLDFIGLDVTIAVGERLELAVPPRLREMAASGILGRKTGAGFHVYRPSS